MQNKQFCKGQIVLSTKEGRKEKPLTMLPYDFSPFIGEGFKIGEILMSEFKSLKFSQEEKKVLTYEVREKIHTFRKVDKEILWEESQDFINKLNSIKNEKIIIDAQNLGSFICLAALLSGELDHCKNLIFNLRGAPVALFPKGMGKRRKFSQDHKVNFIFDGSCWFKELKTLCKFPKSFRFSYGVVEKARGPSVAMAS